VRRVTEEFKRTNEVINVDGARVLFENGWGLVRASNTQAVLVLRFEATNKDALRDIQAIVEARVQSLTNGFQKKSI
jgi:phosphomannomutase/phosphoglucomutase